jgi:hypothetical protein
MSTRIDPRDYLSLESVLVRSIQRDWAQQAKTIFPPIQAAIDAKDWGLAVELVGAVDLSDVGQAHKSLAYSVFRGCMDFGSQLAAGGRSLVSSLAFSEMVKNVVSQWLQALEWSATQQLQRSAMQLIADAQTQDTYGEVVVKKARPVRPFVSFKEDGDKLLQMISALHTNRLSSWGFIAESDMRGLTTYKLNAMLDNRTSDFCRFIHGKTFQIEDARGVIELGTHVDNPADMRSIQPWPNQSRASMEAYAGMSNDELVANKLHVPPFHPNCRTMMVRVSTTARMKKPAVAVEESPLGNYISEQGTFAPLNVQLTPEEVDFWNDYIHLNPIDMMSALSGKSMVNLLDGDVKSTLRIDPKAGVIKLGWGQSDKEVKFQGVLQFDAFFGSLFLTKKKFRDTTFSKEDAHTRKVLGAVRDIGTAVGAEQIILSVPRGEALWYLREGYVPESGEWITLRFRLQDKLEGPLKAPYEALPPDTQTALLRIISSNHEEQVLGLLKLGLPKAFLADLMDDLEYRAILAL